MIMKRMISKSRHFSILSTKCRNMGLDYNNIAKRKSQNGFTLLETMIAIAILTIGILSLYSMQLSAIRGNSRANQITTSANWAAGRVEQLIAREYDEKPPLSHPYWLVDEDGDGVAGLNDTETAGFVTADRLYTQNGDGSERITVNGGAVPANAIPYSIYWNVAVDDPIANTKTIRVITVWNDRGEQKRTVVDYVKASIR